MYQLPLRFVRISPDASICATRIVAIISTTTLRGRKVLKQAKGDGHFLDLSSKKGVSTILILDNGTVIGSPYDLNKVMRQISYTNRLGLRKYTPDRGVQFQVYDVLEGSINQENAEGFGAVSPNMDGTMEEVPEDELEEDDYLEEVGEDPEEPEGVRPGVDKLPKLKPTFLPQDVDEAFYDDDETEEDEK